MSEKRLNIRFFVDGQRFAERSWWSSVPRVGDEVMLGPSTPPNAKKAYRVLRVVWGVEGLEEEAWRIIQCVNVELTSADAPVKRQRRK